MKIQKKLNTKILNIKIILLVAFFIINIKGYDGDGFFPAFGGSFVGSTLSNCIFNRPRPQEVVVVNQPAPEVIRAPDPEIYERPINRRSRRYNQEEEFEDKNMQLELARAENRRLELENRNIEAKNRQLELENKNLVLKQRLRKAN